MANDLTTKGHEGGVNRTPIYVAGYPKSGTTWLTWLLGDLLDSPTGGSTPGQDAEEIASEGHDRTGQYVVRKGHYVLTEEGDRAVPEPHKLNPAYLGDSPVVFVVRDPRDIVVSAAHYYRQPVDEIVLWMAEGKGSLRAMGPYVEYVTSWLNHLLVGSIDGALAGYEVLLDAPVPQLLMLCRAIEVEPCNPVVEVVRRQSFVARRDLVKARGDEMPLGQTFNDHFLRHGTWGDWRTALNRVQGERIQEAFGPVLDKLGYAEEDWWMDLPE